MSAPITAAIFNDTSVARHYGCELVMAQLREKLNDVGIQTIWTRSVNDDWRQQVDEIKKLPRPDIVVVNGEGSIHHTARNARAQSLLELAAFSKQQLGAPTVLINTTLHAMQPGDVDLLKHYDAVYLRSRASGRALTRMGHEGSHIVHDLTLCASVPFSKEKRRGVLSTDSTIPVITDVLEGFAKRNGWSYLPMAHKGVMPEQLEIAEWRQSPPTALISYIQKHRFVVTGRFHCATLAILTKTPVVAVESNTPKIRSLFQDILGDTKRIVSPSELANLDLSAFDYSPGEQEKIDKFLINHHSRARRMFNRLRAIALAQVAPGDVSVRA